MFIVNQLTMQKICYGKTNAIGGYGIAVVIQVTAAVFLMLQPHRIAAQKDSTQYKPEFSGVITLTSNGISQIPAYSLDKPAISAFFYLKLKRFSYEPDINYGVDGRPWGMGNSFMYLVLDRKKLKFKSGLALGLAFSYPELLQDGVLVKINKSERYLIAKLLPSYVISEKMTLGVNYWYARNLERKSIRTINFLSAALSIAHVSLIRKIYFSVLPQIFYLDVDGDDGLFFSPTAAIGVKDFPLYLSSQVNTTIYQNMTSDPGFKWNVALNYMFPISKN